MTLVELSLEALLALLLLESLLPNEGFVDVFVVAALFLFLVVAGVANSSSCTSMALCMATDVPFNPSMASTGSMTIAALCASNHWQEVIASGKHNACMLTMLPQ